MVEGTGDSLALLVAALLTFIVQSSSAVTIFGISLAAVGPLSVDQAMSPLGPLASLLRRRASLSLKIVRKQAIYLTQGA